ncbi:MAG: glutamate carboxypepticase, partial [Collimonas fungivorans]|nr:glutamate carboxypepticase [Collimonas fungivorans]
KIYQELDLPMTVVDVASGGGTDAAFAALKSKGAVVEGMGLSGYGAHSNDAEYVLLNTIVPRLYLSTRLIMDFAQGKVQ